jgi:signal transduction histidine kinase
VNRIKNLERKLEIEIQSRKESEKLLEEKSRELFANSEKLRVINRDLEQIIEQRTHDLEESRDNAVIANLAKSQFLANMSHEIRTPIHGILGMVEVLSSETKDSTQKEYLDNILNAGELLLSIINDILDLSRIESGKIEIEENEFSPNELINNLCIPFGPQASKKGITFECAIDDNLNNKVIGDDNRLRQVLINHVRKSHNLSELYVWTAFN